MKKSRPFLKWAGNKFHCINTILSALPQASRLIEPFTGSGAVFVNSNYNNYLLAEQNKDLVDLFQCLQSEGLSFIEDCKKLFVSANNCAESYYDHRDAFNLCKEPRKRALLFLYLNRHGFNGLCRYNQQGIYNVPFGSYPHPYFPQKEMLSFYEKSQKASFVHDDFRETFSKAQPGDVIYCDPPYVPLSQTAKFASYTDKLFGEHDQIALAQLARKCSEKSITVIISNHDTPFTRHHYEGSKMISFLVRRNISCHANERHAVRELLAVFEP